MMLIREEDSQIPGNKIYTFEDQSSFEVPQRYRVERVIGRGSYGMVCSAVNVESGEMMAIKQVSRLFSDATDCKRVLREVKALGFLHHPNIIGLRDVFFNGSPETFKELYIVMELMDTDMRKLLSSPRLRMGVGHCQYFTLQLLCALQCTHSAHIIHRDLKPANLFTDADCHLKLGDFGLSRGYYGSASANHGVGGSGSSYSGPGVTSALSGAGGHSSGGDASALSSHHVSAADGSHSNGNTRGHHSNPFYHDHASGRATNAKEMTSYVVTRSYRPPELLLVTSQYDYAVDMWGVGCLSVEMVTGKPFILGRDYIHQLNLIIELLGLPNIAEDLPECTSTEAIQYLRSLSPPPRKTLAEFCPALYSRFHDASFLDSFDDGTPPMPAEEALQLFESFLFGLLKYKPSSRMTAKEAIAHNWLSAVRGEQREMEGCEAASCYAWEYDDQVISLPQLRQMFVQEVNEFHAARQREC